ncbi:MAG: hypothetical protein JXL81_01950 [Deltaproteobacteria bacterium]|nr:hypothetical protein [Deltaproteobacteria bacterium]
MKLHKNTGFKELSGLLVYGVTAVFLLFSVYYAGTVKADTLIRVTLRIKEKPISEIMSAIAESSGYDIVLQGKFENRSVTATIENVTVKEAVKKVLRGFNYAAVVDDKSKKIVLMFTQSGGKTVPDSKTHENNLSGQYRKIIVVGEQREKADIIIGEKDSLPQITGHDTRFIQTTRTSVD